LAVGFIAFAWPGITLAVLVGIFAAYAILDGITNLLVGMRKSPDRGRSWAQVVQGVVGVTAGVLTMLWPGITALAVVWLIGAWALGPVRSRSLRRSACDGSSGANGCSS